MSITECGPKTIIKKKEKEMSAPHIIRINEIMYKSAVASTSLKFEKMVSITVLVLQMFIFFLRL